MELTQIRSFLEVARAGSLTLAAERMMLSQPAISQHIQSLEREFKTAILDRTSRGVRLTAAGRVLKRHFQDGLSSLDRAKPAVEQAESGATGHLAIGSAVTLHGGIARCIRRLRDHHPGIGLTVRVARSEVIRSLVLEGQIELGIACIAAPSKSLRAIPLYQQRFVLTTPANHPIAGRQISRREASLVTMVNSFGGPWVGIEAGLASVGASVAQIETETLESIKALVEAGLGCALLPEHDIDHEVKQKRLATASVRRVAFPTREVSLVSRKGVTLSAGGRALVRIMRESFPQPVR